MKKTKLPWTGIFAAAGMAMLILDAKTALIGAKDGIQLCIYTVIPSLFPFIVLSIIINSSLAGHSIPFLRPLCRFCGMPQGSESLLLLGLIGGYPVGAQSISLAYQNGQLTKKDAHRLLGFCSNAGPSFLFGITACLFTNKYAVWLLWGIQILSVIITGFLLPGKSRANCSIRTGTPISVPQALHKSIQSMASICGWVILFRVFLAILNRWWLWLLPTEMQTILIGCLELTNGCTELNRIGLEGVRFLLCACFLNFGGACVGMQTVSVCNELGTGMYFPGKVLQTVIAILLAYPLQAILYATGDSAHNGMISILIFAVIGIGYTLFLRRKKSSGNFVTNGI